MCRMCSTRQGRAALRWLETQADATNAYHANPMMHEQAPPQKQHREASSEEHESSAQHLVRGRKPAGGAVEVSTGPRAQHHPVDAAASTQSADEVCGSYVKNSPMFSSVVPTASHNVGMANANVRWMKYDRGRRLLEVRMPCDGVKKRKGARGDVALQLC